MKKKKNKNFLHAEDAQSTVIGFVLITGIIIASSSIYFASQVPDWTEGHEALHTAAIADDFSELKSLIDGIVLKKGEIEPAGGAIPLKMSPDKVPIFGMSPPGSNLIFNPHDEKLELVVPTGGGGEEGTKAWEQNATSDFNAAIKLTNVDTYSDEVKLSRYTPEGNLELNGTTAWLDGVRNYNEVIIENGGTLYVAGILELHANSIFVDSNSKINADGKGYSGGTADSDGDGDGLGKAGAASDGGGGGGYGGAGGAGAGDGGGSGGIVYGIPSSSIYAGSGGGGGGSGNKVGGDGGNGGGAILLDAEQINIEGNISANGRPGQPADTGNAGGGGGGAGGCILIRGKNVTISGTLSANGGNGGDGKGGGGGGGSGRIKIFYDGVKGFLSDSLADYSLDNGIGTKGGSDGGNCGETKESSQYTSSITHYTSGSFISEIHNTESESTCYGNMTWDATLNDQTIVMKVRTDMFPNMKASPEWAYCPAVSNGQDVSDLSSVSDGHCYVQYCAELSTDDAATTPVLRAVKINYSLSTENPTVATSSGSIKFQSNYLYYPNQVIVYEHGAVIKWQLEGGFMLQPPPIEIPVWAGSPIIEISTVDLTGANYSYSGATSTSVKNRYKSYHLLADGLKYPNLTINVTTDYPLVWKGWFNKEFEEKGWNASYFNVSATDGKVEVKFYGKADGVELYFEKTVIEVEI